MLEDEIIAGRRLHPALSIFFILLLAGLGFVVGGVIPIYVYLPFYPGDETQLMRELQSMKDTREIRHVLYGMQAGATLGGLFLAPLIFMRTLGRNFGSIFKNQIKELLPFLLTAVVVVTFMVVNSIFIEWNQDLHFPEFMKGFESWAREREDQAAEQTKTLTKMETPADLIIALIVIGILPAIGEELVFRGLIQRELFRGTANIHVAVWVAAILFSAIHFQFFGFVPRMMLGALFGYLYYWSGSLWVPILAHFVNNGLSVLLMYFYQHGKLEYDVESTEAVPLNAIILSAFLTIGLLYYLYQYFQRLKPHNSTL
jgi:uncharacterized protein